MAVSSALKVQRLLIKPVPHLRQFLMISLGLHVLAGLIHYLIPEQVVKNHIKNPVKVRFLPAEPKLPEEPIFIETPKPDKKEIPDASKLISHFDIKSHSNFKPQMEKKDKNRKTVIPKSPGVRSAEKRFSKEKLKPAPKPVRLKKKKYAQKKILPKLKIAETAIVGQRKIKAESPHPPKEVSSPISVLAMLDSLDASKYMSLDDDLLDFGDDAEPISLDTKETKYADYFSRIKFQIEQVWTYPLEAARRGISGEITLKFKLSKQGNLDGIRMVDSSGTEVLDRAALQAVKRAAPYYPFPPEITKNKITILATFVYSPTYGNNVNSYR